MLQSHIRPAGALASVASLLFLLTACQGGRDALGGDGRGCDPAVEACGAPPRAGLEDLPLLDGPRGGNVWSEFCAEQPDNAALPRDPRELIQPGVNQGKAVVFNAYWRECDNHVPRPATCGEFRAQSELGLFVAQGQGQSGTPTSFAGGQELPSGLAAEDYNNLWQVWGLPGRPDNFDQLVAERHGSPHSLGRNPYPLPGEDPNLTDGGSGQLPMAYTQYRRPDGSWTGEIGVKVCVLCHNGQLGTAEDGPGLGPQLGGAGSIGDFTVSGYDFDQAAGFFAAPSPTSAITISTNRGTGAIDFFQLAYVLFSGGDPELLLNDKIVFSQAIGNIKSPPWWNLAYRPQKFHGAVLPTDSSRIDMAAYFDLGKSLSGSHEEALAWMDDHAGPFQVWAETTRPPTYPFAVDTQLAEQGAILFHALDLWSREGNPAPRPEQGNGSCASCHGVYSPRFAHDERFLDTPELRGIAAYAVPQEIVRTDSVYADAIQSMRNADGSYNAAIENQDVIYCGLGEAGHTEGNTPVLLAPPLWGVWAAAPYLHNGSLPNVWAVLDPSSERPDFWKRVSTPARPDQEGLVVMGYDTNLQRAYDTDKLGWRYETLSCGDEGTQPLVACSAFNPGEQSTVQRLLSAVFTQIGLTWNIPRPEAMRMSQQDVENRKVYNTTLYSQGNQGHDFTAVLRDAERRALIEYLKTL